MASASDSHRRVEPSISVNRNVTTPDGGSPADTRAGSHSYRECTLVCSSTRRMRTTTVRSAAVSGVFEQIWRDSRLGIGDTVLLGLAVSHRQQPPNTARYSIFGHRRVGKASQLFERRLPVLDA